jgi:L,D-transpeptidase catalytic domain
LSYPIAIPREQSRWQGVTSVSDKRVNPSWTPTPTMVAENPRLPRWVPGGHPMNPLGVRALYLGSSTYRIHGTDAPWTIGTAVSKGCIRMYNQDVLDLYPRVPLGTKVTVTWDRYTSVAGYNPAGGKASGYSSASSSNPTASGGGFFSLFGDDDQPPEKPRRPARSKHPRSASTE